MDKTLRPAPRIFAALFATLLAAAAPAALPPGTDFRDVIAEAKRRAAPAVLYVACIQEDNEYGEKRSRQVSGSAFIISSDGEFVTNWHVVDKATSIRCLLSDGRAFTADCLGSDKDMDIALCRLRLAEGESVPYALFGDSSALEEGTFAIAIGAPYGLNRTLTFGTLSCVRRYIPQHSEYVLWLQTDAGIGPGNSGGPLVDTEGRVIGINALGASTGDIELGFAIPSNEALVILDQLRRHGKVNWSWSGLLLQPLRDFEHDTYFDAEEGVIVAGTAPDSPASRSGLRPLDRIVSVNGRPVTAKTSEDLPGLRRLIGLLPESDPIRLSVMRPGAPDPLDIVIEPRAKGAVEGAEREFKRWDFSAKEINQFATPALYLRRNQGVYVLGTKDDGNADSKLHDEDIILAVDGHAIATLDDLSAAHADAIAGLPDRHRSLFTVLRKGRTLRIPIDYLKENE